MPPQLRDEIEDMFGYISTSDEEDVVSPQPRDEVEELFGYIPLNDDELIKSGKHN